MQVFNRKIASAAVQIQQYLLSIAKGKKKKIKRHTSQIAVTSNPIEQWQTAQRKCPKYLI